MSRSVVLPNDCIAPSPPIIGCTHYTLKLLSWTKLAKKSSFFEHVEMLYFLSFKGYEMHLFRLASCKLILLPRPIPALPFNVGGVGDEEHNFMFQYCHMGMGMILFDGIVIIISFFFFFLFFNNFVQDFSFGLNTNDVRVQYPVIFNQGMTPSIHGPYFCYLFLIVFFI